MTQELRDEHVEYMMVQLSNVEHDENIQGGRSTIIYRVPAIQREVCPDAYEPKLVSIGPLHRHRQELGQMEQLKWKYLHGLIKRSLGIDKLEGRQGAELMGKFIQAMRGRVEDVRKQYSVDIGMESKELVELLVLDGCFLIELFIKRGTGPMGRPWADVLWNMPMLRNDLLLLENQIPFSVLITLFNIAFPGGFPLPPNGIEPNPPPLSMLDFALHYISPGKAKAEDLGEQPDEIHHLLHLKHICLLLQFNADLSTQHPSSSMTLFGLACKATGRALTNCFVFFVSLILMCKCPRLHPPNRRVQILWAMPSARNLKEAGIRFKKKYSRCYMNISFDEESGMLEIPFLSLNQGSNAFFRNLIAYEQCCSKGIHDMLITTYATFMDNIIDTAEDVDILVRHGIIQHNLGSNKDVANLFNDLFKGSATFDSPHSYLAVLYKRVNEYCDSDRHRWRAALVNSYFHSPWSAASLIAAVVLLLLTFGATIATIWQTIYTVKSYEKQFP